MFRSIRMPLAAAFLASAAFAMPAAAEVIKMAATIDGGQQTPALTVPGKGSAQVTFDTDTKLLSWTIEYSGLTSAPAAGHFHGPAMRGENAGVAVPFVGDLASPIKGSATLTDAQATDLLAGKYYINLHTPANKGGEIRGQVEPAM